MSVAVGGLWLDIAVPVILLVIMISMGLELVPADFRRVLALPRATLVGVFGQMAVLPLLGLAFAHWPGLSSEVAIGIVIITACPGGAPSNIFTYLAGANVALSVTLTALSSALCFVTVPLWINLALSRFGAPDADLALPVVRTFVQLFLVTLLPVSIGMAIRARWPEASVRASGPLKAWMAVLMAVAMVLIVGSEWAGAKRSLAQAAIGALALVSVALGLAYVLARLAQLTSRDAFTISIEVGLQNGALATLIVVNLLQDDRLLVFPASYALLAFLPVSAWTVWHRLRAAWSSG